MQITEYLQQINQKYQSGIATEHTFRGYLQQLVEAIAPDVAATNEPKRQQCGAPDYVVTRKEIPVGYIEAKDIGDKDLQGKKANKKQFDRYKASLNNLIFTDYVCFYFYKDGELRASIQLAEIQEQGIVPLPENFEQFQRLIQDFTLQVGQTIKSPSKLAKMMAGKAKMMAEVIEKALNSDEEHEENSSLKEQMAAFKQILIHDITSKDFADIYAQTIAYGMFAARLHDPTLHNFSRQEAAELIPKTNPFLRKLFQYIAGYDLDVRIRWMVDDLADIFRATNIKELLTNFGKATQQTDPVIHFYETFLAEYDPKLRKSRGVWYTPEPVVDFMVRAVDEVLKTEFDLKEGLADTATIKVKRNTQNPDARSKTGYKQVEKEVHRLQILDPATGTGTFLAAIVKHIHQKFKGMQGIWSGYVEKHLLPRLHGFEILMASYAMAHLKLELLLLETGYQAQKNQRLKVYLTNSLEEYHPFSGSLFTNWLSTEALEANAVKKDAPVMCVIGNPPYSGESQNKGEWIMRLMDDYKKEPGGTEKLKERNPKWINDDYVKFMRYAQHYIEKNNEGVLAFINPHGYLDNPTFRGMRWNLLKTYDKLYTIDLHGNAKKKETTPDGGKDENVFDIQQGVSINIFVKTGKKKANTLGQVFHYDLFGKRQEKYDFLTHTSFKTIPFKLLENKAPMYFMVQKDFELQGKYEEGFSVNELFELNNVGIVTSRDSFVVDDDKAVLEKRIKDFFELDKAQLIRNYSLKENKSWKIEQVKEKSKQFDSKHLKRISYRPFDNRYVYFDENFIERSRKEVMQHFINGENVGLVAARQCVSNWRYVFCTKNINEFNLTGTAGRFGSGNTFPLYLYPNSTHGQLSLAATRGFNPLPAATPNLDAAIANKIAENIGLTYNPTPAQLFESGKATNQLNPIDVLDYSYAVLHSPSYRNTYKEFLKIDFPRVPYPTSQTDFWQLVALGSELRQIHLLESSKVNEYRTTYPMDGDNVVTRKMTKNSLGFELTDTEKGTGKVWINDQQYFEGVPQVAWEFYIGGYQPAQKWLKDRHGRELLFEDILHYQKMVVALAETDRIMQKIDEISVNSV